MMARDSLPAQFPLKVLDTAKARKAGIRLGPFAPGLGRLLSRYAARGFDPPPPEACAVYSMRLGRVAFTFDIPQSIACVWLMHANWTCPKGDRARLMYHLLQTLVGRLRSHVGPVEVQASNRALAKALRAGARMLSDRRFCVFVNGPVQPPRGPAGSPARVRPWVQVQSPVVVHPNVSKDMRCRVPWFQRGLQPLLSSASCASVPCKVSFSCGQPALEGIVLRCRMNVVELPDAWLLTFLSDDGKGSRRTPPHFVVAAPAERLWQDQVCYAIEAAMTGPLGRPVAFRTGPGYAAPRLNHHCYYYEGPYEHLLTWSTMCMGLHTPCHGSLAWMRVLYSVLVNKPGALRRYPVRAPDEERTLCDFAQRVRTRLHARVDAVKRRLRSALADPSHPMCRRRLMREFHELTH
jgi:hypothetical protein